VQLTLTFTTPFDLPADHFFFIPQVSLTNGGQFYWLSASRPISGTGTTPFPSGVTDLQMWTRDSALDPDWLRVGTDIVGGATPPTFNGAFSLDGTVVPEPATVSMILAGTALLGGLAVLRRKKKGKSDAERLIERVSLAIASRLALRRAITGSTPSPNWVRKSAVEWERVT
jgi:hypothetical protein